MSLEEIDLLFGERALGTLPAQLEEKDIDDALQRESIGGGEKLGNVSRIEAAE